MQKVDIDTNHGQVAGTIENHYAGVRTRPPEGHPNSRRCPQCHGETWRLTQWCGHCGADLFAIDRKEMERPAALRRLKLTAVFAVISGGALYLQFHVPPSWRIWVVCFGVVSMLAAVAVTKE
jgi:hypothetical protein